MQKRYFALGIGVVVAIVALIVVVLMFNGAKKAIPTMSQKTTIDIKVMEESLREVSELSTLTYGYSDVGVFSEQNTLSMFGNEIGILGTKKSFIITYDGEMKFGVDLSEVSIRENGDRLNIEIPKAQMLSHQINEDSIRLLDQETGLFNSFDVMDYANFMAEQKILMESKAEEKGLFDQAQDNAKYQIESFISAIPGVSDEYRISVDFSDK